MTASTTSLFANRYELQHLIGEGGMGTIHRALDRLTGNTVALKRIKPHEHSSSIEVQIALTREFQTLASLQHPHIIRVLDYGFAGEAPYFTMNLIENPLDLRSLPPTYTLAQRLELLLQLLQALAYLHRRGIVHRDLKPSNVMLKTDGVLQILDFGLAIGHDDKEKMAGTLTYIAPEVIRGQKASIASDLYAVGLIAYELVTGHYPFDTNDLNLLMAQILSKEIDFQMIPDYVSNQTVGEMPAAGYPTLTSDDNHRSITTADEETVIGDAFTLFETPPTVDGDLPTQVVIETPIDPLAPIKQNSVRSLGTLSLRYVIQHLLAKDPQNRYLYAEMVIADLRRVMGQTQMADDYQIRESFLQAATFVGRDVEMRVLKGMLQAAMKGRGSAWLIGGESGVGKTRLMNELQIQALVKGVLVLQGQALPNQHVPFALWRNPLARLVLSTPLNVEDMAILKEIIPDLDKILQQEIAPAFPLEGKAARLRLEAVILRVFSAQQRPILLVLEDLHWAADDLEVLHRLSQLTSEKPLFILGSFRTDEAPDLPSKISDMQLIKLGRLDDSHIEALSYSMLGEVGRLPHVIAFLKQQTEGNAFFLVETVRSLAEEVGSLSQIGQMNLPSRLVSGGVQAIIERRLKHIPESALQQLQLAAVLGRRLDWPLLKAIQPEFNWDQWYVACQQSALLDIQNGQVNFTHDKVRESVLRGIQPDHYLQLHIQIAEAIEQMYPNKAECTAALVDHWYAAHRFEKAYHYLPEALNYLYAISNIPEMIRFCEYGFEMIKILFAEAAQQERENLQYYYHLGIALAQSGSSEQAQVYLEKVLASRYLNDRNQEAELHLQLGVSHLFQGNYQQAEASFVKGLEIVENEGFKATLLNRFGLLCMYTGNPERSKQLCEESLLLSRKIVRTDVEIGNLNILGNIAVLQGDLAQGKVYYEEAMLKSRLIGDKLGLANILGNLGYLAYQEGNYQTALSFNADCLQQFQEIGHKHGIGNTLTNIGHIYRVQNDHAKAASFYRQALHEATKLNTLPLINEIIIGFAAIHQDVYEGLMWLGMVLDDEANHEENRQLAVEVMQELSQKLPAESAETYLKQGKSLKLDDVIQQLVQLTV